VYVDFENLGAW